MIDNKLMGGMHQTRNYPNYCNYILNVRKKLVMKLNNGKYIQFMHFNFIKNVAKIRKYRSV